MNRPSNQQVRQLDHRKAAGQPSTGLQFDGGRIDATHLHLKDESDVSFFDRVEPLSRHLASVQKIAQIPRHQCPAEH